VTAPRWAGARGTAGVKAGATYYEVTMLDQGLARFGWSTVAANLNLGNDTYGIGYGATGMKSREGKFEAYG